MNVIEAFPHCNIKSLLQQYIFNSLEIIYKTSEGGNFAHKLCEL